MAHHPSIPGKAATVCTGSAYPNVAQREPEFPQVIRWPVSQGVPYLDPMYTTRQASLSFAVSMELLAWLGRLWHLSLNTCNTSA